MAINTNCNGFERKRLWPIRGTIEEFSWKDWIQPRKEARIAGVHSEIRTEYLSNIKPQHYCYNNLFGPVIISQSTDDLGGITACII